jgi:hypothetical protein
LAKTAVSDGVNGKAWADGPEVMNNAGVSPEDEPDEGKENEFGLAGDSY